MKGYRTYIAAAIAAVGGVIAMTDWVSFMSDWKAGITALGMAIAMAVFRSITTTPPATPTQ